MENVFHDGGATGKGNVGEENESWRYLHRFLVEGWRRQQRSDHGQQQAMKGAWAEPKIKGKTARREKGNEWRKTLESQT